MGATHFSGPVVSDGGFQGDITSNAIGDITAFTDSTGGTVSDTLAGAAGANPTAAEFENAIASLAAKINDILAALS
jgi:hypothetical protein